MCSYLDEENTAEQRAVPDLSHTGVGCVGVQVINAIWTSPLSYLDSRLYLAPLISAKFTSI